MSLSVRLKYLGSFKKQYTMTRHWDDFFDWIGTLSIVSNQIRYSIFVCRSNRNFRRMIYDLQRPKCYVQTRHSKINYIRYLPTWYTYQLLVNCQCLPAWPLACLEFLSKEGDEFSFYSNFNRHIVLIIIINILYYVYYSRGHVSYSYI